MEGGGCAAWNAPVLLATGCRVAACPAVGRTAYLTSLYGIYAGFFAVLLTIAVYARNDEYLCENRRACMRVSLASWSVA